ncbi:hypothetical protein [Paenibacillus macerans]|uniref:hypothetical protein n=1 Tax=Paenibacillus macerans TaxID=44252 RepID=UPI00203C271F|nr:hypothetical protein [Paenibacillus macerans]MCM3703811.1 hypothetical protein [Paenibacillus macerans]
MDKYYAIINNTTAAPAQKIEEDNELRFELIEGTEAEIHEQAAEKGATRAHLYEHTLDDYDNNVYTYVTTQAIK